MKLAVDLERGILAGGGALHADCEAALLEDGSRQEDVWGADWIPGAQQVTFESLINIRPRRTIPRWRYWILVSKSVWQRSLSLYWVECER